MASKCFTPSRRGVLGFFAAASASAAVALPPLLPAPSQDWRTKPADKWTRDDQIAEARFQVADHDRRIKQVMDLGCSRMEYRERLRYDALTWGKKFWSEDLYMLEAGYDLPRLDTV
jgi:hypothetical protein